MKNFKSIIVLFTIICILLSGCQNSTSKENTKITIDKSNKFSAQEINDAINVVKNKFNKDFHGCKLTDLWYDESKSNKAIESYIENGRGSVNKVKESDIIILFSDFTVDPSGADGSLNPNSKYTNWNWILIRENESGKWTVDDMGY